MTLELVVCWWGAGVNARRVTRKSGMRGGLNIGGRRATAAVAASSSTARVTTATAMATATALIAANSVRGRNGDGEVASEGCSGFTRGINM